MKLDEILQLRGFSHRNIKIIRHTTNRKEIKHLMELESDAFEVYQSYQKTDIFKNTEYIISFRALEGRKAILHGDQL